MEKYRIILRTTFAPVTRPAGGLIKKVQEEEFWRADGPPTKKEWEVKNLETILHLTARAVRQEPYLSGEVIFQKRRLIKLGRKTFELGWKDLPPPEYL